MGRLRRSGVAGLLAAGLAGGCDGAGTTGGGSATEAAEATATASPTLAATAGPAAASKPSSLFLKGQLHAHTAGSMDSETAPEEVVRWYARHGYDFLVITDHNRITRVGPSPLPAPASPSASSITEPVMAAMLVLPGIELTINLRTCSPPPGRGEQCLIHMNALIPSGALPGEAWLPRGSSLRRADLYGLELAQATALGAVAQLDHPNFHHAADAETIAGLAGRGLGLVEIANQAYDSGNEGDATHPSTEALWDEVLTGGARLFATASDDAHDYFESEAEARSFPLAYTGDRGFVMVRAERSAEAIRAALGRGDFYASTGLVFERLELDRDRVEAVIAGSGPVLFEAIGEGGKVLRAESGRRFGFAPDELDSAYVRLRVSDGGGHQAWSQPVFLDSR